MIECRSDADGAAGECLCQVIAVEFAQTVVCHDIVEEVYVGHILSLELTPSTGAGSREEDIAFVKVSLLVLDLDAIAEYESLVSESVGRKFLLDLAGLGLLVKELGVDDLGYVGSDLLCLGLCQELADFVVGWHGDTLFFRIETEDYDIGIQLADDALYGLVDGLEGKYLGQLTIDFHLCGK